MIKIKVCGMRDPLNIKQLSDIRPDYMGFIFYKNSKRYVGDIVPESFFYDIPDDIQKVGVFVNETIEKVISTALFYNLNLVQLHGNEDPDFCKRVKNSGINVIKAFGIDDNYDFKNLNNYTGSCDFFLFDTKTDQYGGSGKKFNWDKISVYRHDIPFFLSGGIGISDIELISEFKHPALYAVDLNSKFEIEPAIKDTKLLKEFINKIRAHEKI